MAQSPALPKFARSVWRRTLLSFPGIVLGGILFSLALTPSLLPRSVLTQGALSGCAFAVGYGIGVFAEWIWRYLGFRLADTPRLRFVQSLVLLATAGFATYCLVQTTNWQNSVRSVMGMAPVESGQPIFILAVALAPAAALLVLGFLVVRAVRFAAHWAGKVLPPRVAVLTSLLAVALLSATVFNGVVLRSILQAADAFFEQLDDVTAQPQDPPADPLRAGSLDSLVEWESIGRTGRLYINAGPAAADISRLTGRPAMTPLRTYVGMRSAETVEQRAELALNELIRIGAFDRSVLSIVMPAGTGWVDPPSVTALEYLSEGDIATVSLQFSYLNSPLSLLVEPDLGTDAARALFDTVYGYWVTLPRDRRPRLYLGGLSLGAHLSQVSAQVFDMLADPISGALWVGPPYTSPIWRWATANRVPGSPAWMPRLGSGSTIRFASQYVGLGASGATWGPVRIGFLQHASDPVVFFSWTSLWRRPEWLSGPRGPDVSPALEWYPVVTFLQLALDMALSRSSPPGFGHVYAPAAYVDAWAAILEPPGWTVGDVERLRRHLTGR